MQLDRQCSSFGACTKGSWRRVVARLWQQRVQQRQQRPPSHLAKRARAAGQGHIFEHWPHLTQQERSQLQEQAEASQLCFACAHGYSGLSTARWQQGIDFGELQTCFERSQAAGGPTDLQPPSPDDVRALSPMSGPERERLRNKGLALIAQVCL